MVDIDDFAITAEERELLKTIWGQRELGLQMPLAPSWRPETIEKNLEYLRNYRYPFLQLINTTAHFSGEVQVQLLQATNGWVIHDYGDAMSSASNEEETGSDGSIIKQQADIAFLMLELAKQKGWAAAELIAGTQNMQRYAWIASKLLDFKLVNYQPSDEDVRCFECVKGMQQTIRRARIMGKAPVQPAPAYD